MLVALGVGDHHVPIEPGRLHDHEQCCIADHRPYSLATQDLTQLWSGESGVEVDTGQPGLRGRNRDLDELAVVRAQHAEVVTGGESERTEPLCEGRRVVIEFRVRDRTAVVDHRGAARVAHRGCGVEGRQCRPPPSHGSGSRSDLGRVEPAQTPRESKTVGDGHDTILAGS